LDSSVFGAVLLIVAIGFACSSEKRQPAPSPAPAPTPAPIVEPVDQGNGVYYFPVTDDEYMQALALFYKEKPYLHCDLQGFTERVIQQNNRNGTKYTETTGFILHCHDIAIDAQSVTRE
jgi:hypothetical protein